MDYPRDWYWLVADAPDAARPYSSKACDYVDDTDADYVAWLATVNADGRNNAPSQMDTEFNLGVVLAPHRLEPLPPGVRAGYDSEIARMKSAELLAPDVQHTNERIDDGITEAVEKWNAGASHSIEARVSRLEETMKGLLSGQAEGTPLPLED